MATITAARDGLFSDPGTWTGGVVPGAGDVASGLTRTVTIDIDVTVDQLVVSSGVFVLGAGRAVVAELAGPSASGGVTVRMAGGEGSASTLTGEVLSASGSGRTTLSVESGTLNLTGNITGGNSSAVVVNGGVLNLTGNITGGNITSAVVVNGGVLNLTGNITGGNSSTVTINGGVLNLTGNITGGSSSGSTVTVRAGGIVQLHGDATATSASAINLNQAGGIAELSGTLVASALSPAVNAVAGTIVQLNGNMINAENGTVALYAPAWVIKAGGSVEWLLTNDDSQTPLSGDRVRLSSIGHLQPDPGDVRAGTGYGADGYHVGTLAVPDPSSVALGVPVDDTVGTAALRLSDVASVVGAQVAAATTA